MWSRVIKPLDLSSTPLLDARPFPFLFPIKKGPVSCVQTDQVIAVSVFKSWLPSVLRLFSVLFCVSQGNYFYLLSCDLQSSISFSLDPAIVPPPDTYNLQGKANSVGDRYRFPSESVRLSGKLGLKFLIF